MKNILIFNLGSSYDVITSSHLVNSYKHEYPQSHIEMVVYKENQELAQIINNVAKIHVIDRELITKLSTNPLYSDAFALNSFSESLVDSRNTNWDNIINYSNDNVSSYLMLAMNSIDRVGTYINAQGIAKTTDKWSNYQNFVASKMERQVIDRAFLRCHMAKTPLYHDIEKLKIDSDYSVVASQNFSKVRQMKGSPATFVVGISLEASHDEFTIDMDTMIDLVESIEDSSDYKAVLLLNGKNYQRKMANDLNERFNNSLISINVDTPAITSVLPNLDALISTSNDMLAIADTMEVKCIEIRENKSNQRTPYAMNAENYVIYQGDSQSVASDILLALNEEFGTELPISILNTDNPTFKIVEDDFGRFMTQIRGKLDIQKELRYHMERSIHLQTMGYERNEDLITHIRENTEGAQITEFVNNLKSELTTTVKVLLATLRSLKGVKSSKSNLNNFISYLDTLITAGREDTFIGSLIRNFEGQIENIEANDIDTNMKMIENHLFELKNNCQYVTNMMTDLLSDSMTKESTDISQEKTLEV